MKQHYSYFEELFDTQQYLLMTKNIQELLKIARSFKKFFQDILSKQLELSQFNLRYAQKLVERNQHCQFPLSQSLNNLGKTVLDLFSGVQDGNLQQSQTLYQYETRVEDQIGKILRHKDEYIQSSIQYYKNDEQTYKKNLTSLQNRIQQYKEQLKLYQQALNDPSLLYNYNLKQQRYTELQQKMKRIREKEQKIQTSLEVLNTRRKSLCVDLKEFRDIIEQGFSEIIVETHQLCCNNIENLKHKLEQFVFHRRRSSNQQTKYLYSILPIQQKTIQNSLSYKRNYIEQPQQQQDYNYIDDSTDTINNNFEEISFRTIKTPNQSMQTIQEPYENIQFPDFILQDFSLMPKSQLISFYDRMIVYIKDVKDNCDQNNGIILTLLQFIESLITQFRKQGKACIKQPDFKQNYFSQLKWFEPFNRIFGEQGYDDLYAYTSINDLFNLYINKFLMILQEQQKSILQVQNKIQQSLAVTFGAIDAQVQELQTAHWNYQRTQGVINNQSQAAGLQKIDQQKIEQQFKQLINESNKAIKQLLEQLNSDLSKNYKTINAIANSIEASFSRDLQEIMKFNHQLQEPLDLKKKAREQIMKFLKSQKSFQIFYKQKVTKNKVLLMLDDLQSDRYDLQFSSENNDFVQIKAVPKPGMMIEQDNQIDEDAQSQTQSEISSNEKDKDKLDQMKFIKSKLKMDLNENLISSFACALSEKIQLQGRLYITNKRLFFHSNFNSSNLFFGDTVLNVPKADILSIQKRTNAFIFDNSISVVTPKGQLFFATFFQRDIAYDLIIKTFSPKEQPELLTNSSNQNPVNQIKIINVNYTQEQLLLLQARQQKLINLMGPDPEIFITESLFEFPQINIKLFFKLIYGDKMPGQNISFYERMKKGPLGCDKVALTQWTPAPPMDFDSDYGTLNLVECSDFLEREFSCLQPLPKSSIPLMPTQCECKEKQKIYFLTQESFVLDLVVKTYKVPYAESFYVDVRYKCEQTEKGIKMTCHIHNEFVKSCMFRKVIEKAGFDEITEKTKQKIFPAIKQELTNYIQGSSNNQNDCDLPETPIENKQQNSFFKQKIFCHLLSGISLALLILIVCYVLYTSILSKIKIKIEFEK